jgi:predicted NACHT family NTPase
MYHYDPETALDELNDDAVLPHPVHLRDMIVRARLQPDRALALNRSFQEYLHAFGELQKLVKPMIEELAVTKKK